MSATTVGAIGALPFLISTIFELGLVPQIVSHTTEYVPAVLTVILVVVAPVFHFNLPLQPDATKIAVSVPQIVVLSGVIVGVVGETPVLMTIGDDDELVPQIFVQEAV